MRLYRVELKRMAKTRSVQLLILFSLLLTLLFSYLNCWTPSSCIWGVCPYGIPSPCF